MIDRARRFFDWIKSPAGKAALFVTLAVLFVVHLGVERLQARSDAPWLDAAAAVLMAALWFVVALAIVALAAGRRTAARERER